MGSGNGFVRGAFRSQSDLAEAICDSGADCWAWCSHLETKNSDLPGLALKEVSSEERERVSEWMSGWVGE